MLLFGISEKENNLGRYIKIFIFIFYWEFPFHLILFPKFKNCLFDWFVLRINNFQKNSPRKFQHHCPLVGWKAPPFWQQLSRQFACSSQCTEISIGPWKLRESWKKRDLSPRISPSRLMGASAGGTETLGTRVGDHCDVISPSPQNKHTNKF